jgi:hypothetical protein
MNVLSNPAPSVPRRISGGWWIAVVVLTLGVGLRFFCYRTASGMPDECITVEVVAHMRQSGDWDANWAKADLSPDLKYDQYNFSTHLYGTFFFYRFSKWLPGTAAWRSRENGIAVYRFFVALLAAASVVLTFQLAYRIGRLGVAIGATLLTGVSTLLVQDAHFIRPEAITTLLTVATVALCLSALKSTWWRPCLAGWLVGLLIACKVSLLMLVWLPLVPVLAQWRILRRPWLLLLAIPLTIAFGFACGAPAALWHPEVFLNGVHHLTEQYAGLHPPHSHLHGGPVYDMMGQYFVATLGWPLVICAMFGLYRGVREKRWLELLIVSGPWLLFFGYFSTKSVFFERNVSHVLPFLFIVATQGAFEVARWLSAWTQLRVGLLAAVVIAIVAIQPTRVTTALVTMEYLGRGAKAQQRYEATLQREYPSAEWWREALMTEEPLGRLAERMRKSQQPVLLRVTDYRDEWTAFTTQLLLDRFVVDSVGVYRGTFPNVPTSTLLTYHSACDWYYLVRGVKTR